MHTFCILFVHIDSSCADFMHTDSVLCRLFADLMHTYSRVNVFHSNAAPQPVGAHHSFLRGQSSRGGGAMTATAESNAPGRSGGSGGGCRPFGRSCGGGRRGAATFEGEAQRSVRRRPSGTAAAGCGGCKPEKGEEQRHARAGMREGRGTGIGRDGDRV
jgi:hypothetical protein